MKIRPVGAEFYADGQTDMTKLIIAFCNFANAPINLFIPGSISNLDPSVIDVLKF
jgi:hypothetical protein